jgi:hypothetical protein
MCHIKNELKIIGVNPILISFALEVVFALLAVLGGELLNLSCLGYEAIFPFFAAISVGEWGRTRADDNYDVIAAQVRSLFAWVFTRFFAVFTMVSLFAVLSMIIVFLVRSEIPLWEMALTYLSPALFLSTLCVLLNLCFDEEHISTLICGTVWLVTMLARSLMRFSGVEYVYLFIRYVGDKNGIWLVNKAVLLVISGIIWSVIFCTCRKKV